MNMSLTANGFHSQTSFGISHYSKKQMLFLQKRFMNSLTHIHSYRIDNIRSFTFRIQQTRPDIIQPPVFYCRAKNVLTINKT